MNLKELHSGTNLISSVSLFHCLEGEIKAVQILSDQQLNICPLEVPALLICMVGKLTIKSDKGIEVILSPSDYFKMDPGSSHEVTALENSNFLLIR